MKELERLERFVEKEIELISVKFKESENDIDQQFNCLFHLGRKAAFLEVIVKIQRIKNERG
jgi:hypothetical protein